MFLDTNQDWTQVCICLKLHCTNVCILQTCPFHPQIVQQKIVKEKESILALDKYQAGDIVSMDQFVVRTSGKLLRGYGQDGDNSWFHGGSIFTDVETGIILIGNRISLGVGETIMAMT